MGKKKKMKADGGGDSQYSPSTVFVTGLPYSLTNAQVTFFVSCVLGNSAFGRFWYIFDDFFLFLLLIFLFLAGRDV